MEKKCDILIDIIESDRADYKNETVETKSNTENSDDINNNYQEEKYMNENEKISKNTSNKGGISNDKKKGKK